MSSELRAMNEMWITPSVFFSLGVLIIRIYWESFDFCHIAKTNQTDNDCMYYLIADLPHVRTLAFANSNNRANKEIQTHGRVSVQGGEGEPGKYQPPPREP